MNIEYEKDYYCEECKVRTTSCSKENLCVAELEFIERNWKIGQLIRQNKGTMTIGDVVSMHGRVAALRVIGEMELSEELEKAETFLDKYQKKWDDQDLNLEERKEWVSQQSPELQKEISDAYKIKHGMAGVVLSRKREELL